MTEILQPLTAGKYPATGVVQQAAARGSRIHELCALFDLEALPDELEPECAPYLAAWYAFCRDYGPTWDYVEAVVWSPRRRYAGTVDRVAIIDGRRIVLDIKTAQSLDRPAKIALACQTAAYASALREIDPCGTIQDCWGVQLLKSGDYRIYKCGKIEQTYDFDALDLFEGLRDIHRITKGE